ncbi:EAL domain-containing protein [Halioxenophilus sp. WMMB6]|uniref:EAL domain-containing response regulator n=1 Tax=Halioxenophilus sp. WMMB6 TaxID=3073815 RepID=UPI00295EB378|nr:EAL domain-containing protein [Halioxenophilus sp. WMMB6]
MNLTETLRLLLLNDSRSEVERLVSMLRNAGVAVRTQHAESLEALSKLLQEQTWDLLIGHDGTTNLPIHQALKEIARLNRDIPVVLVTEDESSRAVVEGIRGGATDVVLLDDDQHLLLVIEREVKNREQRQTRRVAERKRREAEQRAMELLESSRDAIAYIQDGMFVFVNQTWGDILGYDDIDDLAVMPFIDLITDSDQERFKECLKKFSQRSHEPEPETLQLRLLTNSDQEISLSITVSLSMFDNEPCVLIQSSNVPMARSETVSAPVERETKTDEASSQQKLRDQATGLFNRTAIYQRLEKSLDDCAGSGHTHAFLLLSIADFERRVVATLGYRQSDQAVKELANRLSQVLAEQDFRGRFSDSSLGILLLNTSASKALELAQKIIAFIGEQIIEVKTKTVHLRPQIGISLISETIDDSEQIVEHARIALDAAREADAENEGACHLFELPEKESSKEAGLLEVVQQALQQDRLHLLFQPIIGLRGSDEEQYEVLVRVLDEHGQQLSNQEVFNTVDDLQTLGKIDRWVVLEAAKRLAGHRAKGYNTRLVVNLSQAAFFDTNLPSWLKVALKAADLSPDSIIFQLKESDVADHLGKAKAFVDALKANGTPVCITNFGCVLNPMNTLKHIMADFIKVDGSYTRELQDNTDASGLTNLVKELHSLKKITIVPFVENAAALSKLWQAGVHYIQGHYLQEPNSQMNYDFESDG